MFKPRYANKSFARLTIPGIALTSFVGGYFYYRTPTASPSTGGQADRTREKRDKEALGGAGIGGNATSGGHEPGQPGGGIQPGTGDVERVSSTGAPKEELPSGGVGGGVGAGGANVRAIEMSGKKSQGDTGSIGDKMGSLGNEASNKFTAKLDSGDSSARSSSSPSSSSSSSNSNTADVPPPTTSTSASKNTEALGSESSDKKVRSQSYPSNAKDHRPNSETRETQGTSFSQRLQGAFGTGGKKSSEPGEVQKKYQDTKIHSNHADTPTKRHSMRSNS